MKFSASSPTSIVIATRESQLAMWQAEHVQAILRGRGHSVDLLGMTTRATRFWTEPCPRWAARACSSRSWKWPEEGRADLAVHSLKDVPMELPEGFVLACVMTREDPRDAFVSNRYASLDELPQGAVVGTSSLRRQALLQALRPDLKIEACAAMSTPACASSTKVSTTPSCCAAAGLMRLEMSDRIRARFDPPRCCPPPARAHWASRCAQTARTSSTPWLRWPICPPG
jgi:hydroxymethylbilane synthase